MPLKTRSATGRELAASLIKYLEQQQQETGERIERYQKMKERNDKAIEIFNGRLYCNKEISERNCYHCGVYFQHEEVPGFIESSIFESS